MIKKFDEIAWIAIIVIMIFIGGFLTSRIYEEEAKCQAGVITITELRKEIEKRHKFYLNDGGEYQLRFTPNGCVKVIKNTGRR